MRTLNVTNMTLSVDFAAGHITSLLLNHTERIVATTPCSVSVSATGRGRPTLPSLHLQNNYCTL